MTRITIAWLLSGVLSAASIPSHGGKQVFPHPSRLPFTETPSLSVPSFERHTHSGITLLDPIASFEGDDDQPIYRPRAVSIGDDGNLYVLEGGNFRVAVYSTAGEPIYDFGRRGQGPGEFGTRSDFFDDLAVSSRFIATLHRIHRRINLFDSTGKFIRSVDVVAEVPMSVELTEHDELIVGTVDLDATAPSVHRYSVAGQLLESFGSQVLEQPNRVSLNGSFSSIDPAGRVLTVQRFWPLVTTQLLTDPSTTRRQRWLDLSSTGNEVIAAMAEDRRELIENRWFDINSADLSLDLFQDAEPLPEGGWALLAVGGYVHIVSPELVASETYGLNAPDGKGVVPSDIAISRDRASLCANDTKNHRVVCYALPAAGIAR